MGRKLSISLIPSEPHYYVCYGFNSRPSVIVDIQPGDGQLPANTDILHQHQARLCCQIEALLQFAKTGHVGVQYVSPHWTGVRAVSIHKQNY